MPRQRRWKTEAESLPIMRRLYHRPGGSASLGGAKRLIYAAREEGVRPMLARKWLESDLAYTLHIPARRRLSHNRVPVNGKDEQWQADLVYMQQEAEENDGYKYLLTVIDVLSKYAMVVPLKNKTGVSLVNAVDVIFEQGRVPERLQTDAGKEFLNKHFQKYLKTRDVRHFVTYNETKDQIVERFNRTLGMRMWRYCTLKSSHRYVDVLSELARGYNASYRRSIGMRPDQVTDNNALEVWRRLYGKLLVKQERPVRFKFKMEDWVRITKKKRTFEKGYLSNWMEEIFRVVRRVARRPPVYQLSEYDGAVLKGTFYDPKL